ncbi:MAG: hypothetical protein PHY19_07395 [Methanocellales archaeon]|nr:hypothetical protein [Methanocellales archaeon]
MGYLDDPEKMRKIKYLFYISLILCFLAGFFVHGHPHFWYEELPAFHAAYGFASCVLIIIVSKALGRYWLSVDEDYYDKGGG